MTDGDSSRLVVPPEYELFRRSSRRAAVVSVVCGVLILGAIGGSAWQVARLQGTRSVLEKEVGVLEARKRLLEDQNERAGGFLAQDNVEAARAVLEPGPPEPVASDAAPPANSASLTEAKRVSVPRIYFQIRSRSQVSRYEACVRPLGDVGARVPPYELLPRGPSRTELRYFHANEERKASELQAILQQCLGEAVTLSRPPHTNVNPLHFEVWLAAPNN